MDQRITTKQVLRVVGVHRTTLFRWTRLGLFPPRLGSGGWLRSDVDDWLSRRMEIMTPRQGPAVRTASQLHRLHAQE
ncbi:MAG: AlpA family phage regulatory protein [Proteobacteria bacterium]|nr:AlpA family phage regulatory protein [Pseudomonadota bacterium]